MNLKISYRYVALSNLSIYYTCENINISYKYNTFRISAPTFNEVFKLPGGSYSLSEIKDYIENITKKHEKLTDNPPIRIYVNKL